MAKKSTTTIINDDIWLEPFQDAVNERITNYQSTLKEIKKSHGSLLSYSNAHRYLGFNYDNDKKGWYYREWAPEAFALFLIGDFNEWNRESHPLEKIDGGNWEIFLPDKLYRDKLVHKSLVKVHVHARNGHLDRIPAYIKRVIQNTETYDFVGQFWNPSKAFKWSESKLDLQSIQKAPLIYEAHIGISLEEEKVSTYKEFTDLVLPKIKKGGYNVIQLMAIQEHPYYGSFGYHVSNFYAPSSRFGTPEDLKNLIDKAHKAGIAVVMDIVHSHTVKNIAESLNQFDGTQYQYFHDGGKGLHPDWDSMLFDYSKREVKQFLLSNIRYWLEEFHFDGFRFDGVTSMLYEHHGNQAFDHYDKYFYHGVDKDAILYLQLANTLIKEINPAALSIAEDMSGMPGLCRPPEEGGIGFDYRLGMGIPDFWIKYLKERADENWDIFEMWNMMTNRRYKEKTIAYAESHDQAIVGDKTIAFRLMDKEMYYHMRKDDSNLIIDRGIALHKLIRLFTIALGGEGYMNFIGNEFGHPEWVDFPREGNSWSYKYAKRQWALAENPELKYEYLENFDKAMIALVKKYKILESQDTRQLNMDSTNNVVIFQRAGLIFLFNFHPNNAIFDYKFEAPEKGNYKIILSSDDSKYGGFDRPDTKLNYKTFDVDGKNYLSVYLTNRTTLVLEKKGKK